MALAFPFPPGLIVSVSGFRGRVGAPLTPDLVAYLAAGFGAFLEARGEGGEVYVGRDSRTSGSMLLCAAVAGLRSVGFPVVEVGLVPTPTLLLALQEGGGVGGIMVSASHNPADWNALKFATGRGMFLDESQMNAFVEFLRTGEVRRAPWDALGEVRREYGAAERHLRRVVALPYLDLDGLRHRRFRVAMDCVNGAGGSVLPALIRALGCDVEGTNLEPHGRFPRDPEPTAANLASFGEFVRSKGAEVGLAVDPDVDRLSLVDETGRPLGEDLTLALAAAAVLRRRRGAVVANLSTSQVVGEVAAAYGVPFLRAPVGEIHVARRMEEVGAVVGGEGNGGVILPELHLTRDALVAAALVLQSLLDEGCTLGEAVRRWPSYAIVKRKAFFAREALEGAYQALLEDLRPPEVDRSDGLQAFWPDRRTWLHVRPSGTEPIVRLIAEAPTAAEAEALLAGAEALLGGFARAARRGDLVHRSEGDR